MARNTVSVYKLSRMRQAKNLLKLPNMPKRLTDEIPTTKGPFGHMWTPDHLPPKWVKKNVREAFEQTRLNPIAPKERIRQWTLACGDKVEIVSGEHAGRRGRILRVDKLRNNVYIDGVNMQVQKIPIAAQKTYGSEQTSVPGPIDVKDVRLLEEIFDENGNITSVIVDNLVPGKVYWKNGRPLWNRWVEGQNRTIPYPEREEKIKKAFDVDTREEIVKDQTFTLDHRCPIPDGVINELRSNISRRARKEWGKQYYEARELEIMSRILTLNEQDPQRLARIENREKLKVLEESQRKQFGEKELNYIEDALRTAALAENNLN